MSSFSRRNFIQRGAACVGGIAATAAGYDLQAQGIAGSSLAEAGQEPAESERIRLNSKEYFAAPGFSFLVFHNDYQVGFQGGLQMIQNGERILDSGDFYIIPRKGERAGRQAALRRLIDSERTTATVEAEVKGWKLRYNLICTTDGEKMAVRLKTLTPVPWDRVREAGFRIYIYPGDYYGKSFQGDNGSGNFPRQYDGRHILMKGTSRLLVAAEDPGRSFLITRSNETLQLADNRIHSPQPWFSVEAPLKTGSSEVRVEITPSMLPGWRRTPVIGISQIGYHPAQPKRAVIELDPRDDPTGEARLYRLRNGGTWKLVKSGRCKSWGEFLRYQYTIFDFTEVKQTGMYKWLLAIRKPARSPFKPRFMKQPGSPRSSISCLFRCVT